MSFDVAPSALRRVRNIVGSHLELWGDNLQGLTERTLLVENELLTNVLKHTQEDNAGSKHARMLIQRVPDGLCVNVHDWDTTRPRAMAPTFPDEHGRGLLLVRSMADDFGVSVTDAGKDVWASILHQRPPARYASPR